MYATGPVGGCVPDGLSRSGRLKADAMDSHGDRRQDPRPARLPVIRGARWFGPEHGPLILRIEQPVTVEEMVAVLYGAADAEDLATDETLCGSVVVTLLIEGLAGLEARVMKLREDEKCGAVGSPDFLAQCRERVSSLLAS